MQLPDIDTIVDGIADSLKQQGFTRKIHGEEYPVKFLRIGYVPNQFVAIWIDVNHLPPRVSLDKLMDKKTLHTLSTVLGGLEVRTMNTTGLAYIVVLNTELPKIVYLGEPTIQDEFPIPIGRARGGDVWESLNNMGHVLIAGITQSGKTLWLKTAVTIIGNNPNIDVYIIDPKQVGFAKIGHLAEIVSDVDAATLLLNRIYAEMERRKTLFTDAKCETFQEWRKNGNSDKMIVVIVDEFTSIALEAGLDSDFYTKLKLLSSQSAAFGIHLFLATQNPKAEILNTLIRSNCDTRIAFRVATKSASKIILDEAGAEKIRQGQKGRFLFRHNGHLSLMQGFLLHD